MISGKEGEGTIEDLFIQEGVTIPGRELLFQSSLSGGPGGQHVNKTHSRITLRWHVDSSEALSEAQRTYLRQRLANRISKTGYVVVHCGLHRQQHRNKMGAIAQLKALLLRGLHREKKRKATQPTRSSQIKRVQGKKKRGELKDSRRKPKWP